MRKITPQRLALSLIQSLGEGKVETLADIARQGGHYLVKTKGTLNPVACVVTASLTRRFAGKSVTIHWMRVRW
ncbi:MAG TPA: hypothetical protein ENJ43_05145 [Gammaproteobacteria bacterium]|nr:hypothetical protein [Gammaproteobacteria bacterium]